MKKEIPRTLTPEGQTLKFHQFCRNHVTTAIDNRILYRGIRSAGDGYPLLRGCRIPITEGVGSFEEINDPFVNVLCIINGRVDDVNPGNTFWHADAYQSWGPGMSNRIIYGFYATNLHYQGMFLNNDSVNSNNAFVNIFIEMREPGYPGHSGGDPVLDSVGLYGTWDHLLMWHCSFLGGPYYLLNADLTNSSFVGNAFFEFRDFGVAEMIDPPYSLPGNSESNEFLYNHYQWTAVDQGNPSDSKPHWRSKSPDSSPAGTSSIGDPAVNLNITDYDNFGYPRNNSPLENRLPFVKVPIDARGHLRDSTPDIGALEANSKPFVPLVPYIGAKPSGLRIK